MLPANDFYLNKLLLLISDVIYKFDRVHDERCPNYNWPCSMLRHITACCG